MGEDGGTVENGVEVVRAQRGFQKSFVANIPPYAGQLRMGVCVFDQIEVHALPSLFQEVTFEKPPEESRSTGDERGWHAASVARAGTRIHNPHFSCALRLSLVRVPLCVFPSCCPATTRSTTSKAL